MLANYVRLIAETNNMLSESSNSADYAANICFFKSQQVRRKFYLMFYKNFHFIYIYSIKISNTAFMRQKIIKISICL